MVSLSPAAWPSGRPKGYLQNSMTHRKTPLDHTSAFLPSYCSFSITSGAASAAAAQQARLGAASTDVAAGLAGMQQLLLLDGAGSISLVPVPAAGLDNRGKAPV